MIAAASTDDKLETCREHGADDAIDYAKEDLKERVKALTNGSGADVVYDPVGGQYTEAALRATAWNGRLLVIGFAAGEIPKIPLNLTLLKGCVDRRRLHVVGAARAGTFCGGDDAARRLVHRRQVQAAGVATFPLERAADAIALMASRKVTGKVVLTVY